jgi:hypothetical protein
VALAPAVVAQAERREERVSRKRRVKRSFMDLLLPRNLRINSEANPGINIGF